MARNITKGESLDLLSDLQSYREAAELIFDDLAPLNFNLSTKNVEEKREVTINKIEKRLRELDKQRKKRVFRHNEDELEIPFITSTQYSTLGSQNYSQCSQKDLFDEEDSSEPMELDEDPMPKREKGKWPIHQLKPRSRLQRVDEYRQVISGRKY